MHIACRQKSILKIPSNKSKYKGPNTHTHIVYPETHMASQNIQHMNEHRRMDPFFKKTNSICKKILWTRKKNMRKSLYTIK